MLKEIQEIKNEWQRATIKQKRSFLRDILKLYGKNMSQRRKHDLNLIFEETFICI